MFLLNETPYIPMAKARGFSALLGNKLSQAINYDLESYAGTEVTAHILKLRESLPESYGPNRSVRGIALFQENQLIGAYIDHERGWLACALDGTRLNEDYSGLFNQENEYELMYKEMEPEKMIELYYDALDRGDTEVLFSLMSKKSLDNYLHMNVGIDELMNEPFSNSSNVNSAQLLTVERWDIDEPGRVEFMITVDMDYKKMLTGNEDDGVHTWFIIFEESVEELGYRIVGIGTGP
jgi:hypothetical protein